MVTVTPDQVRDRVKLSSTDIEDAKATESIKDAEATIEEKTGLSVDYANCSQAKAATITNLAVNPTKNNSITTLISSLQTTDQD